MAKISFNALCQKVAEFDLVLSKSDSGVYRIGHRGDYGPAHSGDFRSVHDWFLGFAYYKQHNEFHYILIPKRG